jgi:hypothetical protein
MVLRRVALRLGAVVMLVGLLAGCASYSVQDAVSYVPGFGYVVYVERLETSINYSQPQATYFYYVFATEEEARQFVAAVQNWPGAEIANTHQPRYDRRTPEYQQIACAIGGSAMLPCSPGYPPSQIIDRVVPPVPTALPPQ